MLCPWRYPKLHSNNAWGARVGEDSEDTTITKTRQAARGLPVMSERPNRTINNTFSMINVMSLDLYENEQTIWYYKAFFKLFFDFRDRPPADPKKSNFCNILKSQIMGVNVGMRQKRT